MTTTETDTPTRRRGRTLDQRMAWVQRKLEDVPRSGHADVSTRSGANYSYDYLTEADLMIGIRPLLAEAGIAFYYSDAIVHVGEGAAHVRIKITLAASGEQREFTADGYSTDMGDKHVNKAKTAAMRYWLWKTFLQPNDADDGEQENVSAADAAHADEARRRADAIRRGSTTRRTETATSGNVPTLIQRITALTTDLDEVQSKPAGRTLSQLQQDVADRYGRSMPELEANQLVEIGKALTAHLAAERAAAERDGLGYDPTGFEPPRP